MVGGPYKNTNDLILAAESSLALLAQMEDGDVESAPHDLFTDDHSSKHDAPSSYADPESSWELSELAELSTTAPVESSVLDGRAHVKVQFPDGTVEYVDVHAASTTVGTALALAWKKRHHTSKFLDKKHLRGFFQSREVALDWFLLDCGLALEGTLQMHITQASAEWTSLASSSTNHNLSISSAYQVESERHSLAQVNTSIPSVASEPAAEWLEHQVRPEEQAFAAALERFFLKVDMTDNPNALCQHILTEYTNILQAEMAKQDALSATSPFQLRQHHPLDINVGDELRNERNTWRLLFDLRQLSVLRSSQPSPINDDDNDYIDATSSDLDAVAGLDLRPLHATKQTVLSWLESIASEHVSVTSELRNMQHSRTLGRVKQRSLSFSMDPDSTLREGDHHVDKDDVEDDADLLKGVWQLVRAGRLKEAADLCIQLGQPWRAASLSGGTVCGNDDDDSELSRWGNPLRILWKQMCWQFAEARPTSNLRKGKSLEAREYEAIVYGALSGNSAALLRSSLCESWEDHCWALLNAAIQYEQDGKLLHLLRLKANATDLFVENQPDYLHLYESFVEQTKSVARFSSNLSTLFNEVAASSSDVVRRQASHPHRRLQSKLIVSDVDSIVSSILKPLFQDPSAEEFSWDLRLNTSALPSDALPPQLVRFASHFVLFMTATGETFDTSTGYLIQKAYIRHLIKHSQHNLVALYASRLPEDGQASIYVQFLTSIRNADARQQGLQSIAKYCCETCPRLFAQITKDAVQVLVQLNESSDDMSRIQALRLLCLDPRHRGELLHQANRLARHFVAERKPSRVKSVLQAVPDDSLAVVHDACRRHVESVDGDASSFSWQHYLDENNPQLDQVIREFLSWTAFVAATDAYDAWRHVLSHSTGGGLPCFDDEEKRVKVLTYHATNAIALLFDVLQFEGGWLSSTTGQDDGTDVSSGAMRAACLPFVVFSLYRVCTDAIESFADLQHYPTQAQQELTLPFAQKALQLASVVANDQYKVYESFDVDQVKQLLHLLQQSASSMLDLQGRIVL
ncbi:hypothetical protein DYB25_009078 [Aphanomyces astaci]|uniref:Nuclear pore complex protein n=1 Tax=Aphanomyces astaci TaxID=112090 RepID=A0A397A323_APHAT|nr:hypothetical protein DYB25_009078 [Aphanomyces astaci]